MPVHTYYRNGGRRNIEKEKAAFFNQNKVFNCQQKRNQSFAHDYKS